MGTQAKLKLGYSEAALDRWAERAKSLARGAEPAGLKRIAATRGDGKPRDVYLYVIGGAKQHNPAAAMALIRRLG